MLTRNQIKRIRSLDRKKVREESGLFLVEGNKMVEEALRSRFDIDLIACTPDYDRQHPALRARSREVIATDPESLAQASLFQHPQDALAIVRRPGGTAGEIQPDKELCLALDGIQDPGNLGTILRVADWFGIRHVICSEDTVDAFNPKVVQASMGSIFRVEIHPRELPAFLRQAVERGVPVYGTFLEGDNLYQQALSPQGLIVLGNEAHGISDPVRETVTRKLLIPSFSSGTDQPQSLNVALAAAICCSEFRRRAQTTAG